MPSADKIAKYRILLQDLLPRGKLWDVLSQPSLKALLGSMAVELARVDDRIQDALQIETDPRVTTELLEDWERLLGLPDECSSAAPSPAERRALILRKYTSVGGISASYYQFLIAQLGFTATVTKPKPFQVGRSRVGHALTNDFVTPFTVGMTVGNQLSVTGWLFYFNVDLPASASRLFVVGDTVGLSLRELSNPLIQCTIKKLKPAHAGVTFTFTA